MQKESCQLSAGGGGLVLNSLFTKEKKYSSLTFVLSTAALMRKNTPALLAGKVQLKGARLLD